MFQALTMHAWLAFSKVVQIGCSSSVVVRKRSGLTSLPSILGEGLMDIRLLIWLSVLPYL